MVEWTFKLFVANLAADLGFCAGQEMPRAGKDYAEALASGGDGETADLLVRTNSCVGKFLEIILEN